MGLAWTSHGGSTLYIETLNQQKRKKKDESETGNGGIEFTGEIAKTIMLKGS
jgi:ATP-dependent Lon protease